MFPHTGCFCNVSRNGTQAVPYGFAGGQYHSTTRVAYETWRAADCRPYRRGSIQPHRLYLQRGGRLIAAPTDTPVGDTIQPHGFYSGRFRNGTQAVPYGFADWFILEPTDFKNGHVRPQKLSTVNCQLKPIVNCPLIRFPVPRPPQTPSYPRP